MEAIAQFIPFVLSVALSIVPAIQLLGRIGKSRWWAAFTFIPGFGVIILLWIVAYSRWPPAKQSVVGQFE